MSVGRTNVSVFVGTLGLGLNGEDGLGISLNVVDGRGELVEGRGDPESTSGRGNNGEPVVEVVATALNDSTVVVIILALVEVVDTTDRFVVRAGVVEDFNLAVTKRVE